MPPRAALLSLAPALLALAGCVLSPPPPAPAAPSAAPPAGSPPAACSPLGPAAERIEVDGPVPGELHELHELPDASALWAEAPRDAALERYRDTVAARLGGEVRPPDLMQRQKAIYASIPGRAGEAANAAALLEGRAGRIGPIQCVELLLWRRQVERFPMIEHPTEFGAFILRSKGLVRVYFSSADRVGQKIRGEVTERVAADAAAGFEVVAHLHNHPFLFDRVVGDRMWTTAETIGDVAGAVAPSMADVQAWRSMREGLGIREARVTNGLDTARFTAGELDRLTAAE